MLQYRMDILRIPCFKRINVVIENATISQLRPEATQMRVGFSQPFKYCI